MPSKEVQNMIPKIQRYFATQPIERAYLFGSCARGEEKMNELSDTLGRSVDMVEERRLLPFAIPSTNHDKLLIYERAN